MKESQMFETDRKLQATQNRYDNCKREYKNVLREMIEKSKIEINGLDDNHKFELIEPYYPDKAHLMGLTEMWEGIDWSEKVGLWEEEQKGFHGVKI